MKLLFLSLLFLVGCEPEIDVDGIDKSSTPTCSYSGIITIDVGVDITSDFSESGLTGRNEITSSNCSTVSSGNVAFFSAGTVTRSSSTFTVIESGVTDTYILGSGNNFSPIASQSASQNGISISVSYPSASIDPSIDTLIFNYKANVTGLSATAEDSENRISFDLLNEYF